MNIQIVIFDGVDELDFIGPLEIFRRAAQLRGDSEVLLTTLRSVSEVTTAHGLRVRPDGVLDSVADLLLVPGGGYVAQAAQGIAAEISHGELPRRIAACHKQGCVIAGVCTGVMAIAAAGLLEGRPAVTHHAALEDLRSKSARVMQARVVDDGQIVTCGGVTSSLDLALWLVERFWGATTAESIAETMEYRRSADVYVSSRAGASLA